MNDQKYLKFIEPWIQKAEKELTLIAYCNKNDKSKLSRDYFDCVLQYNIALAKRHLKATSDNKLKLEESKKNLLEIITKVKASDKELNTLNIEKEHENTCQLFLNAGKEYAKNLSFWDLIF